MTCGAGGKTLITQKKHNNNLQQFTLQSRKTNLPLMNIHSSFPMNGYVKILHEVQRDQIFESDLQHAAR